MERTYFSARITCRCLLNIKIHENVENLKLFLQCINTIAPDGFYDFGLRHAIRCNAMPFNSVSSVKQLFENVSFPFSFSDSYGLILLDISWKHKNADLSFVKYIRRTENMEELVEQLKQLYILFVSFDKKHER